jgi:signal transduction histidine kinase
MMDALRRRFSLRWLLAGSFATLFSLTLIGLGVALYWQTQQYLLSSSALRMRLQVQVALERSSSDPFDVPEPQMRRRHELVAPDDLVVHADEIAQEIASRLMATRIMLADGTVLATGGPMRQIPPVSPQRLAELAGEVRNAIATQPPDQSWGNDDSHGRSHYPHLPSSSYFVDSSRGRWHVLLLPLMRGSEVTGVIQVATRWREADALLNAVRGYTLWGIVLGIVLGVGAGAALAALLARPLEQLAATARRVAQGDLQARTQLGSGRNEVYLVAAEFDHMVDQVQGAFAAQRRFVADASHELKTPLTAIGGMSEVLRLGMDEGDADKRGRALDTIEKEVDKMNRLVSDLLTLSRAEQAPELRLQSVDVSAMANEVATYAQTLGKAHQFKSSIEANLRVAGDPDQLQRVLRNLLDNAFKYTPAGGAVELSARRSGTQIELAVSDRGIGIPADALPHVFERFYRADPSRARKTGGSGLGLSIVKALVEQHGGTVTLNSAPEQGTTVTVRLPAESPAQP